MARSVADTNRSRILLRHFTKWCAKFQVFPEGDRFASLSGRSAYPGYSITESDGTVWMATLETFDESGIRGQVENNRTFRQMLLRAASAPDLDEVILLIGETSYQVIFQNTQDTGGPHIINVVFIQRTFNSKGLESAQSPCPHWQKICESCHSANC